MVEILCKHFKLDENTKQSYCIPFIFYGNLTGYKNVYHQFYTMQMEAMLLHLHTPH